MKVDSAYTPHHPKWYRRNVSVWWWLERWCYTKFVLRELTSLFVAFAACIYVWLLRAVMHGPDAYAEFLRSMQAPPMLVLHAATFAAMTFHAMTWFHLAPRAIALRIRGKSLPDRIIIGLHYGAWLAVSMAILWILLRGIEGR
jgi:fumarate reductase subunit C